MLVQAGSMLEPYFNRVLLPYLEDQIKVHSRRIKEINTLVLANDAPKTTTRRQHYEIMKRASILVLPSSPGYPRPRTLSSPSTPLSRVTAIPFPDSPQPPTNTPKDSQLRDLPSSPLALPPPVSPRTTPGLLARATSWLPGLLASPFLPSPRVSPPEEQEETGFSRGYS